MCFTMEMWKAQHCLERMCVHMCTRMDIQLCVPVCACAEAKGGQVSRSISLPHFLEEGPLTEPSACYFTARLWMASEKTGLSIFLATPIWGSQLRFSCLSTKHSYAQRHLPAQGDLLKS